VPSPAPVPHERPVSYARETHPVPENPSPAQIKVEDQALLRRLLFPSRRQELRLRREFCRRQILHEEAGRAAVFFFDVKLPGAVHQVPCILLIAI
jgi:hypothetical protein